MAFQVLNREPDRSVENVQAASNAFVEGIQKTQALKQTAEYYKLLARQEDNKVKQAQLDRKAKGVEYMIGIMEKVKDPQMRGIAYKVGIDAGVLDIDTMHDGGAKAEEIYKIMTQQTEGEKVDLEKGRADAAVNSQKARIFQTLADQNGMSQNPNQVNSGLQNNDPMGGVSTDPSQAARVAATSGQQQFTPQASNKMMVPSMNIDGINIVNPQATSEIKRMEAYATAQGSDMGKKDIGQQNFQQYLQEFKTLNDQLPRSEKGGIIDRINAGVGMNIAGLNQDTPEGYAVATYDGAASRLATTIARQTDVGNLNEQEQLAAKKLVPSKYDSKAVSDIKMAFIEDINRPIGTRSPEQVRKLLASYQQKVQDVKNPETPRAKAQARINGVTGGVKKQYVRTGIDSETGKRVGQLADGTIEEIGK